MTCALAWVMTTRGRKSYVSVDAMLNERKQLTAKKDSLAVRAARGEYDLVVPLDYKIMQELPVEGTMLAGMYNIGTTVKELGKKYPMISPGTLSGRLRVLEVQGLVLKVKLVGSGGSGISWQCSEKGVGLVRGWLNDVH